MTITMLDGFAGAGGSSTGGHQAGVVVSTALNHWQKAVDVHNANHPDAQHICADISQFNPRRIRPTTIAWFSPECTWHSRANSKKNQLADAGQPDLFGETLPDEAADRSRATMWDVVRFTEAHRYQVIIVENVVEVVKWETYAAWLMAMDALGYEVQIVSLNSMHAQAGGDPAPQSRDRFYAVFHRRGNKAPDLAAMQRPRGWCSRCELVVETRQAWRNGRTVGRYRQQYDYVCTTSGCGQRVEPGWLPAAAAIDWSLPGTRIGDRTKDLAPKTRRRIAAGIARYWGPLHLEGAGNTYDAADPRHRAFGDVNAYYRAWPVQDVLKALHTTSSKALAVPPNLGGKTIIEPEPFIAELRGGGSWARPTSHPASTFTASGNHHALVAPYYGNSHSAQPVDQPVGTLTTVDRYALVMRNNPGGAEMSTPVSEPIRTLTTAGHQSLLTPGDLAAAEARVDDCLFRMFEPHEVAAGMAFPTDYTWSGTRRERVKMAGNAVTPPAARDLIAAVVASLS